MYFKQILLLKMNTHDDTLTYFNTYVTDSISQIGGM